ncbi:hypothetical protein RAF80_21335, partial [Klebsiella pneumoniae]
GLAIDQIAQSGLSSLSVIYYSAQLFRRLTSIGLNVKIACLGEEGLDPGEATQEQILKAYYRAKPYSKQLELQSKVLGIRVFNS